MVDAQTGLDYVLQHETLSKTPIVCYFTLITIVLYILYRHIAHILTWVQILYGQSIGGAVAIDLASKNTQAVSFLRPRVLL